MLPNYEANEGTLRVVQSLEGYAYLVEYGISRAFVKTLKLDVWSQLRACQEPSSP